MKTATITIAMSAMLFSVAAWGSSAQAGVETTRTLYPTPVERAFASSRVAPNAAVTTMPTLTSTESSANVDTQLVTYQRGRRWGRAYYRYPSYSYYPYYGNYYGNYYRNYYRNYYYPRRYYGGGGGVFFNGPRGGFRIYW